MAIISFRHRFIFIKTRKTGGTSIEVELARRVEDAAVVTRVIPAVKGHEPRNWSRGWLRKPYYNHMPATLVRRFLGEETFGGMYRFCVEREPVSKCMSHFHMLRNSPDHARPEDRDLSWDAYCARGDFPVDVEKYSEVVDGRRVPLVDRVLAYETMGRTLREVMDRVGIMPFDLDSRAKGEYSAKRIVGKDDVTPTQRARIYDAFAASIEVAGLGDIYAW